MEFFHFSFRFLNFFCLVMILHVCAVISRFSKLFSYKKTKKEAKKSFFLSSLTATTEKPIVFFFTGLFFLHILKLYESFFSRKLFLELDIRMKNLDPLPTFSPFRLRKSVAETERDLRHYLIGHGLQDGLDGLRVKNGHFDAGDNGTVNKKFTSNDLHQFDLLESFSFLSFNTSK